MSKTGRPEFKVTAALRSEVSLMLACGMTHEAIARAIGCTPPTLYKHFADELAHGAAKKRREILQMLHKSAKAGNVSAQKKLEEVSRGAGAAAEFERATSKPEPAGKKAAAAEAAKKVGGEGSEWGDDLRVPDAPLN